MQRKKGKTGTRYANAAEQRFQSYTKECDCIICDNPGPSIVDHVMGATWSDQKTLVGHWFVIPLCLSCDTIKTQGSRRGFKNRFDVTFSGLWLKHVENYALINEIPHQEYSVIQTCRI